MNEIDLKNTRDWFLDLDIKKMLIHRLNFEVENGNFREAAAYFFVIIREFSPSPDVTASFFRLNKNQREKFNLALHREHRKKKNRLLRVDRRNLHESKDPKHNCIRIVKFFNKKEGYGFIEIDDVPDVFVYNIETGGTGSKFLNEGDRMNFEVERETRRPKAKNVLKKKRKKDSSRITVEALLNEDM